MPRLMQTCPECGNRFPQAHHRQLFCIPAHSRAYNNRILGEGQSLMGLAKAWRAGGTRMKRDATLNAAANEAYILMCRAIDASNTADREAGRMHPTRMYLVRQNRGMLDY